jgi:hypothetical protein
MGQLPPAIWATIVVALLVAGLLAGGTVAAVVRAPARRRITGWPATRLLALLVAAIVPWLIVVFAPLTIRVSIHGVVSLIGWIVLVLLVFALLVLLPLAVVASGVVWWAAWRRRRANARVVPPPA